VKARLLGQRGCYVPLQVLLHLPPGAFSDVLTWIAGRVPGRPEVTPRIYTSLDNRWAWAASFDGRYSRTEEGMCTRLSQAQAELRLCLHEHGVEVPE